MKNSEIKTNVLVQSKLMRKNRFLNWETYFGCLSGGYIYFYKNPNDEEYVYYFYIKDSKLEVFEEKPLEIIMKNNFHSLDLKFFNEDKKKKWQKNLQQKINEMKIYFDSIKKNIKEDKNENTIIDNNIKNFGLEIQITNATFDLVDQNNNFGIQRYNTQQIEKNKEILKISKKKSITDDFKMLIEPIKLYSFKIKNFHLSLVSKCLTSFNNLTMESIKLIDYFPESQTFEVLIKSRVAKKDRFEDGAEEKITIGSNILTEEIENNENNFEEGNIAFLFIFYFNLFSS